MSKGTTTIPSWLMISVYVLFLAILLFFTDMLTFIVGTIILTIVFANGYDRAHHDEEH